MAQQGNAMPLYCLFQRMRQALSALKGGAQLASAASRGKLSGRSGAKGANGQGWMGDPLRVHSSPGTVEALMRAVNKRC